MSTYWGFVCKSHDPELSSERWFNWGQEHLLRIMAMAPGWAVDKYGQLDPEPDNGDWQAVFWVREHPRCVVWLENEYGAQVDPRQPDVEIKSEDVQRTDQERGVVEQ